MSTSAPVDISPLVNSPGELTSEPDVPPEFQRTKPKVAILGFTESINEAPFDEPDWDLWGCNNLHLNHLPRKADRWFDLHDAASISEDQPHVRWLETTDVPVFMWTPQAGWPSSVRYPKEEIVKQYGRYFTNTISWEIALAISMGYQEIGVFGVDMAQGTEYAAQRPSCEYFLGLAVGVGIRITIPNSSDLLKSAALYGAESDSALRHRLEARETELNRRLVDATAARDNAQAMVLQLTGALETTQYVKTVWTQPEARRDGAHSEAAEPSEPVPA